MKWIGIFVGILGVFLFFGNAFGYFRTFPLAGCLCMGLGYYLHGKR